MKNELAVILTVKSFRDWLLLQTCPNIKGVMKAGDSKRCPIACYLRELYPGAEVWPTGVTLIEFGDEIEMPSWAEMYVVAFDERFGVTTASAEQALEVLDIVISGNFDNAILSLV